MTKQISCIFKFSYKNISTKISILNQVSDNENHVWHAQSHYNYKHLVHFHKRKNTKIFTMPKNIHVVLLYKCVNNYCT